MQDPPMDWQAELDSPIFIEVNSTEVEATKTVPVVSLPVNSKSVKIHSYFFDPSAVEGNKPDPSNQPDQKQRPRKKKPTSQSKTRIAPPKDVVKLGDRLFYLLQPPLETLLQSNTIELPFEPFDFQYTGVAFLFPRHNAILADEMGLGKTMQSITTIRMLLRSGYVRSILLICPKPLVTNWKRELSLWAPEVPVSLVGGSQAKRQWQWENDKTAVKIANYELIVRDQETVTNLSEPFDLVVIDEAQRIKNKSSTTSKTVRNIARKRSWALTGTPIENTVEDLFGIFEFVAPGALNPHMSHRELKNELSDYVLRRTKEMVIDDMPPKLIRDTELALTSEQAENYEAAEKEGVIRLSDLGDEITVKHVFELVLRLKQICNFDPATGASSKLELLESDLEEVAASGQESDRVQPVGQVAGPDFRET